MTRHCTVPGCTDRHGQPSRHLALGWCRKHYQRFHRHGDPLVIYSPGPAPAEGERRRREAA